MNPVQLTSSPGDKMAPCFSPDGAFVAYARRASDNETHLWVIGVERREERQVTFARAFDSCPAWSHDGKWIAFQSDRAGKSNLYVVSAGQGETDNAPRARALTKDSGFNGSPSWSADDRRIAFESDRNGRFDVWVMNASGDNEVVLTRSTSHDTTPAWSPDGKLIAFSSDRAGDRDVWMMNPDGSLPRRLTTDAAQEWRPRWTPDSRELIYMRAETPARVELWSVFLTGRGARQVVASSAQLRDPVVSPDGTWLVFSSNPTGVYQIYLLKLGE